MRSSFAQAEQSQDLRDRRPASRSATARRSPTPAPPAAARSTRTTRGEKRSDSGIFSSGPSRAMTATHQRRMREAVAVLVDRGVAGLADRVRSVRATRRRRARARASPCDAQEPERHALAVVGHAHRGLQHAQQRRRRPGRVRPVAWTAPSGGRRGRRSRRSSSGRRIGVSGMGVASQNLTAGSGRRTMVPLCSGLVAIRCPRADARCPMSMPVSGRRPCRVRAPDPVRPARRTQAHRRRATRRGARRPVPADRGAAAATSALGHSADAPQGPDQRCSRCASAAPACVMRYRELIARSFDDFRGRPRCSRDGDLPLGLVGEGELDFHLAGQRLAESIGRRYQQPLEMLDLRFEALAHALGAPPTHQSGRRDAAGRRVPAHLPRRRPVRHAAAAAVPPVRTGTGARCWATCTAASTAACWPPASMPDAGRKPAPRRPTPVATPPAHVRSARGARPRARRDRAVANAGIDLFRVSAEARVAAPAPARHAACLARACAAPHAGTAAQPTGRAPRTARAGAGRASPSLLQRDDRQAASQPALAGARQPGRRRSASSCSKARAASAWIRTRRGSASTRRRDRPGRPDVRIAARNPRDGRPGAPAVRAPGDVLRQGRADRRKPVRAPRPSGAPPARRADAELRKQRRRARRRIANCSSAPACVGRSASSPTTTKTWRSSSWPRNELQDLLQQQRRRAEIVERRSAETVHGRERLLQARLQAASALAQRISARPLTHGHRAFPRTPLAAPPGAGAAARRPRLASAARTCWRWPTNWSRSTKPPRAARAAVSPIACSRCTRDWSNACPVPASTTRSPANGWPGWRARWPSRTCRATCARCRRCRSWPTTATTPACS